VGLLVVVLMMIVQLPFFSLRMEWCEYAFFGGVIQYMITKVR